MAKGLVEQSTMTAIADAIRAKNNSEDTYTPAQMADAISAITSGGGDAEYTATVWKYIPATNTFYVKGSASGTIDVTLTADLGDNRFTVTHSGYNYSNVTITIYRGEEQLDQVSLNNGKRDFLNLLAGDRLHIYNYVYSGYSGDFEAAITSNGSTLVPIVDMPTVEFVNGTHPTVTIREITPATKELVLEGKLEVGDTVYPDAEGVKF